MTDRELAADLNRQMAAGEHAARLAWCAEHGHPDLHRWSVPQLDDAGQRYALFGCKACGATVRVAC